MLSVPAFVAGLLVLLFAPGPTNLLIALSSARSSPSHVVRLIAAELAGYLTAVIPLAFAGHQLIDRWPVASFLLKAGAAAWVMVLALRLWQGSGRPEGAAMFTVGQIYLTTLCNPKALVIGLALLPSPAHPAFTARLLLFGLIVIAAAISWSLAGRVSRIGTAGADRLSLMQRVASLWLAGVSLTLAMQIFRP